MGRTVIEKLGSSFLEPNFVTVNKLRLVLVKFPLVEIWHPQWLMGNKLVVGSGFIYEISTFKFKCNSNDNFLRFFLLLFENKDCSKK
jgi:hypothetical protein